MYRGLKFLYYLLKIELMCILLVHCTTNLTPKLLLMDNSECDSIEVRIRRGHSINIISNDTIKQQLLNVLHTKHTFKLCKMPPNIKMILKGKKHEEHYIICEDYIKDNKGSTYKYDINIEEAIYAIMKRSQKPNTR